MSNFYIEGDVLKTVIQKKVKTLIIPEGIRKISFYACEKGEYEEVILPNSLEVIESFAFAECKNLEKIVLPPNVNFIGKYAFSECNNLKKIVLPPNLTFIGRYAFYRCYQLEEVALPETIETIEENAFKQTNIKKIFLPKNLKEVGNQAFQSKEKITIYCEDEPKENWVDEIKEEDIVESYPDPDAEGFNFHRSSGGWQTVNVVVGVKKVVLLWSGDNAEVISHFSKQDYENLK